jgi:hypothetical protein
MKRFTLLLYQGWGEFCIFFVMVDVMIPALPGKRRDNGGGLFAGFGMYLRVSVFICDFSDIFTTFPF